MPHFAVGLSCRAVPERAKSHPARGPGRLGEKAGDGGAGVAPTLSSPAAFLQPLRAILSKAGVAGCEVRLPQVKWHLRGAAVSPRTGGIVMALDRLPALPELAPRWRGGTIEFPLYHMRGGTSTGLVIWERYAPADRTLRAELLRHLM